jgi:hypothetical protein
MKSSETPQSTTENELESMRRALGLSDHASQHESPPDPRGGVGQIQRHEQDRRARRFVRDGEVPVVVLNRARDTSNTVSVPSNRLALAESALRTERTARERAERALHEAQINIQHLQTQMGHAALAHAEALAVERESRELAERRVTEITAERDAAQARLVAPVFDGFAPQTVVDVTAAGPTKAPKAPRKTHVGRQSKAATEQEQQAVKWWLPTFKSRGRSI